MRVLHVIAEMGVGGAESLVVEMVGRGSEFGWESGVGSSGGMRIDDVRRHGCAFYPVPLVGRSVRGLLAARRATAASVRAFRPDIVVAHNVSATVVARAARPGVPILSVFHGVGAGDYRMSARVLSVAPTRVVAVAEAIAGRLRAAGMRRVPMTVIHNAVTTPVLPDPVESRRSMGLAPETPVALSLARLEPQKRHDVLIDAWGHVTADAVLLVAGDGSQRQALEQAAAPLGERVRFLGNRSDVPALLAAADITVLTSDWEGLPIAILESLAAGVPVVASDVDGLREILGSGGGWLVPPGQVDSFADAMNSALTDPSLRRNQAEQGRKTIDTNYSATTMMSAYDATLRAMLNRTEDAG